jgi:hypothetical protein
MKPGFPRFAALSLLLVLVSIAFPALVHAQAGASVILVTPNNIFSDVATIITVDGSGFDSGSRIFLDGSELPGTVVVSASQLQVTVPAGTSIGSHMITVSSGGVAASGSVSLNVSPPATPPPATATATTAPASIVRPQIGVEVYRTKPQPVQYGQDFKLTVKLRNEGQAQAYNVQATFTSTDYLPTKNGGVEIVGDLLAGNSLSLEQPMVVGNYVYGFVSVEMNLSYNDVSGTAYTEKFTLNIESIGGSGVAATATPTGVKSSQLVITSYATSADPLQPGVQFTLTMTVQNNGNVGAQRVTMIVGGGSSSGTSDGGTPQPGGVSGGSGEFTNFAPVGASNIQTLGDLPEGGAVQVRQDLIVNVSTSPGAYPMKVTFSYLNTKGEVVNDEQVITLLVYSLPTVDISFYRPPDPFFVGQPGPLPIQVVNLGKRLSVLGTMKITSEGGTIENGTSLIGSLDAGGYFTLDAMVISEQSGPMTLDITIDYTDDFNQPRTINRTLEIEVMEGMAEPILEPGMEGGGGGGEGFPTPVEETALQKVWRFILGLFGLDSAPPSNNDPGIAPGPGIEEPVPAQPGAGKG